MTVEKFLMLLVAVILGLLVFVVVFAAFKGQMNSAVVTVLVGSLVPLIGGYLVGQIARDKSNDDRSPPE